MSRRLDKDVEKQLVAVDEIKAYYQSEDVVSGYEDERFSGADYVKQANEGRAVVWALDQVGAQRVLEVASGTGRLARKAADAGHHVVCLDFSEAMLRSSRSRAVGLARPPVGWLRADAFCLPMADASADAVICFRFLRHFQEQERMALLSEIARVLAPGGVLVLDVANAALHRDLDRRFIYDEVYSQETFAQEARQAGFDVVRLFGNGYTFLSRRPLRWLWRSRSLVAARSWLETVVLSRAPGLLPRAFLWSAVCQKS